MREGILLPPGVLGSSAQDRHGLEEGPEEGQKNGQKVGAFLQCRQAERVGLVQPKEEKMLGIPYCSLLLYKGVYKIDGERLFNRAYCYRSRGSTLN